jgi:hypothetical protein
MSTTTTINELHPDDQLIKEILSKHPKLAHLKASLKDNIATLNDNLLTEQGLEATLDLLSQFSRIELLDDKIKKTKPTNAPLPRSIRLNITLTSLLEATREAQEFKALQSEAENIKLYFQQKMRQLIVQTLSLDRLTLKKQLRHFSNIQQPS